jgi:hypothetical protein
MVKQEVQQVVQHQEMVHQVVKQAVKQVEIIRQKLKVGR